MNSDSGSDECTIKVCKTLYLTHNMNCIQKLTNDIQTKVLLPHKNTAKC